MGIIRNILAHILIIAILSTSGVFSAFAEDEGIVLHSLDELPSIQQEKSENQPETIDAQTEISQDETLPVGEDEGEISGIMTLPEYNQSTDIDTWFDQMGSLVRMGIIKRRIIRSLSLPGDDKSISVHILEGTNIRTKNYDDISLDALSVDATTTEKKKGLFHFGLTGKHLIFSKPVEIEMKVEGANNGEMRDIQVKHAGDKAFNTNGLSTHPDTECNADGTATIPSNSAVVQDGKIKFYTCGASTFIIGAAGTNSAAIWLISGSGTSCTTSGCAITTWADRSGNNRNGTVVLGAGGSVKYDTTNQLNFNPTIALSGAQINFANTTTLYNYTVFYVLKATDISGGAGLFSDGTREFRFEQWSNAGKYGYTHYGVADYATTLNTQWNKYQILRYNSASGNTIDVSVQMGSGRLTQTGWNIGRVSGLGTTRFSNTAANVNGGSFNIAEMLGYSGQLSATNLNRVESYLALKYGITLDQTTPTSYTYSNGSIVWSGTVAGVYKNDIAGIGRDNATTLNQLKSQSINNTGDIIVALSGASMTNLRGLVWGNDGTATGSWVTTELPSPILMGQRVFSRITREWKFQESLGDVGNVKISYPATSVPANATGTVIMLTDSDGNFSNGGTAFILGTLSGGYYEFSTNINNGSVITFAQSTGIDLWLKADVGTSCTTSGCVVSTWFDQNSKRATGTNNPLLLGTGSADFNFNRAISFNGVGTSGTPTGAYYSLPSGFDKYTAGLTTYVVARPSVTNNYARFYDFGNGGPSNNLILYRSSTTDSLGYTSYNGTTGTNLVSGTGIIVNNKTSIFGARQATLSTSASLIKDGKIVTNGTTGLLGNVTRTLNYIGRSNWAADSMYGGGISEILIYNTDLSTTDRNKVESYLALKYGITLDQSTATNYVYSNGTIVWNATTASGYKNNIAGIGRDDTTSLNQKKSQSNNSTTDIIVEFTGATLTNLRALTWANDGTATGTWINTENPPGYRRINREWKFQETLGDVGNVKVAYPMNSIPSGSTGSIYALVDIDGNFSSGSTAVTGSLVGGNYEFSMNASNGSYITFGYKDITPPNLSLSGNVMSGRLMPTGKGTIVLSYDDTESGISTGTLSLTLEKYNSTLGSYDAATSSGLSESGTRTIIGSTWTMNGVTYGKYRLTAKISDRGGNQTSTGFVFFVDGVDWTVSSDRYALGDLASGITTFGSGSLTITVKTVGAGFSLTSSAGTSLTSGANLINYWDGTKGWGYDTWNGSSWTNTVTTPSPTYTIANVSQNINQNGDRNIYTYTLRYGANIDAAQVAGNYTGTLNFGLNFTY